MGLLGLPSGTGGQGRAGVWSFCVMSIPLFIGSILIRGRGSTCAGSGVHRHDRKAKRREGSTPVHRRLMIKTVRGPTTGKLVSITKAG